MPTYTTFKHTVTVRTVTITKTVVNEVKSPQSEEQVPEADMSAASSNLLSKVGK